MTLFCHETFVLFTFAELCPIGSFFYVIKCPIPCVALLVGSLLAQCVFHFHFWTNVVWQTGVRRNVTASDKAGNPCWRGRISTVDLLVQTNLYHLKQFFSFYKTTYLCAEVNRTELFPLVRIPWTKWHDSKKNLNQKWLFFVRLLNRETNGGNFFQIFSSKTLNYRYWVFYDEMLTASLWVMTV